MFSFLWLQPPGLTKALMMMVSRQPRVVQHPKACSVSRLSRFRFSSADASDNDDLDGTRLQSTHVG